MIRFALVAMVSCAPPFRECPAIEPAQLAALPDRLSATGLFADLSTETLAPGVQPFTPQFPAWSDAATKRRWIYLPPGSQIDTSDPDAWNFPAGTKLWKEFTRDGMRVETRLLFKHGAEADEWTPLAYAWADDGDAHAAPAGVVDARGTHHDIPSATTCGGCHGGTPSGILGFSAIQLPAHGAPGEVGLDALRVTRPVPATQVPGDPTTRAALGYLHANCSHCHNQVRPHREGPRCFDPERSFSFMLRTGELATPAATATYRTAIGDVISAGDPEGSEIIDRLRSRSMPALGNEDVDEAGVEMLVAWIHSVR